MNNLYVYMFRSRNKDNKDIPGFKERCKTFLEYEENEDKIIEQFTKYANDGVIGESTRMYKSVNARDENKVRESLIIRLLKDKPPMNRFNSVIASVAQQADNRAESKWLFDFDIDNELMVDEFIKDIEDEIVGHIQLPSCVGINVGIEKHKTPHGYAVIVPHGFDTRNLFSKWDEYDVILKRDELLFIDMIRKE